MVAWPCMCQKQKPSPWKVLQQQVKHGETSCFLSPFSRWQCEYLFQGISNDLFEGLCRNLFQGAVDTFFKVLPSICEEAATCQTFSSKTLQLRRSSRSRLRLFGVCSHIWRKGGGPTPSLPQRLMGGHRRQLQPCSGMPNPPFPPPRISTKHIGTLWPFSRSLRGGGPWSASGRSFCEPHCRPRRWSWHRPPPGPFSRRASSLLAQHRLFQDSCASRQQQLACLPFSRKILPFSRYQLQWDLPPFSRSLDLRRSCCSLLLAFFSSSFFKDASFASKACSFWICSKLTSLGLFPGAFFKVSFKVSAAFSVLGPCLPDLLEALLACFSAFSSSFSCFSADSVAFFKAASCFSMSAGEETGWSACCRADHWMACLLSLLGPEAVPLPAALFLLFSILFQGTNKKQLFQGFFKPFSRQPFSRQEGGKQNSERCLLVCVAMKLWTCCIYIYIYISC